LLNLSSTRALVARSLPRNRRAGYPAEVRAQVVAVAAAELADGHTLTATARELGLHPTPLGRWLESPGPREVGFVPVRLDGQAQADASPPSQGLALVSPAGFRLEGLDRETALFLLERLA